MANSYGTVTVETTATAIIAASTVRRSAIVYNNGTAIIYIGTDASVTTSNGIPLLPQSSIELSSALQGRKLAIYGIAASGSQDVRYLVSDQ